MNADERRSNLRSSAFICGLKAWLAADFDAIAGLKFRIFNRSRLDLLNAVANCHEATVGSLARDFDAVFLSRSAARCQNGLKQCNSRLEQLLSRVIDAASDVVELLWPAGYCN